MLVTLIRTVILYILVIFGMRLMGKRQLAELQPSELVVAILISNIATLPFEDTQLPIFIGVIPILVLITLDVIVSILTLKFKPIRKLVSGNPMIIIKDGVIDQKAMQDIRFSVDDLMAQLRNKDVFDIDDVAFAVVETTGTLSVYKKYQAQNVTTQMLGLEPKQNSELPPTILISGGKLVLDALSYCKIDKSWVQNLLKSKKIRVTDVYLMTCNPDKDYIIVKKDEKK
ncbi:MAG: DUF421 domain-containing protein [Oscillospiraceae bacterium]